MSKRSHAVHVPEVPIDKDMSRAQFDRPPGCVGIYLEVNDADPVDPHEYGSRVYFLRQAAEKLGHEMKKVSLERVKGIFERKCLISDAIFDNYCPDNVIAVACQSMGSLSDLWTLHEKDLLTPIFQELYITETTLKHIGAKSLQLTTRMWQDEYEDCKGEITEDRVPQTTLAESERDQTMIRLVKKYHSHQAELTMKVKDALNKFDKNLGEFIMILKQNLPKDVDKICSYKEFLGHVAYIKKTRSDINARILDGYSTTLRCVLDSIEDLEDHVVHPLLQVHASCETPYQRDLKQEMRESLRDTRRQLQPNFDFYRVNHKDWQAKILLREQKLFLGLVSVLALAVETLVDIDDQTDEYMSAIGIKIKA